MKFLAGFCLLLSGAAGHHFGLALAGLFLMLA